MDLANRTGGLVVGTGDLSELAPVSYTHLTLPTKLEV